MASKYIQKFPIPEGFPEILHDLSKEILRYQPENINEFCALYFKCLQEGKELNYAKKGQNIPCDFKNVIPGTKSSERPAPIDKSNYAQAIEKSKNLSNIKTDEDNHDPYAAMNKVSTGIQHDAAKVNEVEKKEASKNISVKEIIKPETVHKIEQPINEVGDNNMKEVKSDIKINTEESNKSDSNLQEVKRNSQNSTTSEGMKAMSSNYVNELMTSMDKEKMNNLDK